MSSPDTLAVPTRSGGVDVRTAARWLGAVAAAILVVHLVRRGGALVAPSGELLIVGTVAVVAASWGAGPAVAAVAVAVGAIVAPLVPHVRPAPPELLRIGLLAVVGVVVSLIGGRLRRHRADTAMRAASLVRLRAELATVADELADRTADAESMRVALARTTEQLRAAEQTARIARRGEAIARAALPNELRIRRPGVVAEYLFPPVLDAIPIGAVGRGGPGTPPRIPVDAA